MRVAYGNHRSRGWLVASVLALFVLGGAAAIGSNEHSSHSNLAGANVIGEGNSNPANTSLVGRSEAQSNPGVGTPNVVATIPVGNTSAPEPPAFDPVSGELFVPDYDSNNVSIINGSSDVVTATVAVGTSPIAAVYDPTNNLVYVVNAGSSNVSVISGSNNSLVSSIGVGGFPNAPTLVPASGDIYVSNSDSGNISVISAATDRVTASIEVGDEPEQPVLDGTSGDLYVANDLYISVIDPNDDSVVDTIRIPSDLGLNPPVFDSETGDLYFTEARGSDVLVLSGANDSFVGNVSGAAPTGSSAVLDPLTGDLYVVANEGSSTAANITVVATPSDTVLGTILTPGVPQAPVLDAYDGNLYVPVQNQTDLLGGLGGGNVSVINGIDVETTLAVGQYPLTPTYDSTNHDVYVANWGSIAPSTVSVISPNGTSSSGPLMIVSFSADPNVVPENHTTTLAVVASGGSGVVSYNYSGLPPGCVTENAPSLSCSPGALGYFTVNATVSDAAGHSAQLSTGLSVVMAPAPGTSDVVFEERGLPVGHLWSVTLSGSLPATSVASLLTVDAPNGSYTFTVGSISGFAATPGSGSLHVSGSTLLEPISFRAGTGGGSSNSGWLGLPNNDGAWLVSAVLVLAIGIALAWLLTRGRRGKSDPPKSRARSSRESMYDPPSSPPPPS
ncbi:MAG: YncE family protein [Thermoplasmata archaeon]